MGIGRSKPKKAPSIKTYANWELTKQIEDLTRQLQVRADLHFQQLKVKFLLKSSVLPQNRVGFGLLLSRRNLTFN